LRDNRTSTEHTVTVYNSMPKNSSQMYFYAEEGGTPTPYMGSYCCHLVNTISHLNYLLQRRCGLMSTDFTTRPFLLSISVLCLF